MVGNRVPLEMPQMLANDTVTQRMYPAVSKGLARGTWVPGQLLPKWRMNRIGKVTDNRGSRSPFTGNSRIQLVEEPFSGHRQPWDCGTRSRSAALRVRFFSQRLRARTPKKTSYFGVGNRVVSCPLSSHGQFSAFCLLCTLALTGTKVCSQTGAIYIYIYKAFITFCIVGVLLHSLIARRMYFMTFRIHFVSEAISGSLLRGGVSFWIS